jgi:hypothetical protein
VLVEKEMSMTLLYGDYQLSIVVEDLIMPKLFENQGGIF